MRFSLALVLALALAGCGSPTAAPVETPPSPSTSAPPASSETAPAPAAPVAQSSTKKTRTRTGPSKPGAHDGTKPKNGRPLNPHDASGRTVFVRADDHCFVEVASKDPDTQATEEVDCPPEANDPAFDHCAAQIVLEPMSKTGPARCYCVTGRGNPRPMPNPTPCPASR